MSIKISIVTICLNSIGAIESTMESVINQTYDNIEFIVIDGGSTDGTLEYLESIRDKIQVLISEKDDGIYDAMNKGIKAASGDYILFINSGDRLASHDVLSKIVSRIENSVVRPKIISGRTQLEYNGELLNYYISGDRQREDFIGFGLPHQATLFEINLQKANMFDKRYRVAGDHELWRRLESKGLFDVTFVDDVVAIFSLGGASNDPRNDTKRYLERTYVDYLYSNQYGLKEHFTLFIKPLIRSGLYIILPKRLYHSFLRYWWKIISRKT